MVNAGKRHTKLMRDGWTVLTKDRSLSAQWEHTLLVTEDGVEVLTLRSDEDLPSDQTCQLNKIGNNLTRDTAMTPAPAPQWPATITLASGRDCLERYQHWSAEAFITADIDFCCSIAANLWMLCYSSFGSNLVSPVISCASSR